MALPNPHPSSNPYRPHTTWLADHLKALRRDCDEKARQNARDSPLLRLPTKLRYKIYKYALGNWRIRLLYTQKVRCQQLDDADGTWFQACKSITSLLRVCRQIHAEARHLPFRLQNEFELDSCSCLSEFRKKLQAWQKKLVTHVRIRVRGWGGTCFGDVNGLRSKAELIVRELGKFGGLRYVVLEGSGSCLKCCVALRWEVLQGVNDGRSKGGKKVEVCVVVKEWEYACYGV